MSKYDLNRSIRIVFEVEELREIRDLANNYNMSVAEFCKGLVKEFLKCDKAMKEKKND